MYGDILDRATLTRELAGAEEIHDFAGLLGTAELIPMAAHAATVNIVGACCELGHHDGIIEVGLGQKITVNGLAQMIIEKAIAYRQSQGLPPSASTVVHLPMRAGEQKNVDIVAHQRNLQELLPEFRFRYDVRECVRYDAGSSRSETRSTLQFHGVTTI